MIVEPGCTCTPEADGRVAVPSGDCPVHGWMDDDDESADHIHTGGDRCDTCGASFTPW